MIFMREILVDKSAVTRVRITRDVFQGLGRQVLSNMVALASLAVN